MAGKLNKVLATEYKQNLARLNRATCAHLQTFTHSSGTKSSYLMACYVAKVVLFRFYVCLLLN